MASNSEEESYTYEPLTKPTLIRILRIIENDDNKPLRCELETVDLDNSAEAPKYAALSYSWGYPEERVRLICNGKLLRITTKLDEALRQTHVHNTADHIWVDQVCINQEDLVEKGQQIRLMTAIYQLAWIVLAWLGPSNDTTRLGIEQIEKVANTWRTENMEDSGLEYDPSFDPAALPQGEDKLTSLALHVSFEVDADAWVALSRFFDRPWFERVWIVQEMICIMSWGATRKIQALVVCGEYKLDWSLVVHAAGWIQDARGIGHAPPTHPDQTVDGVEFAANLMGRGMFLRTSFPSTVGGEIRGIGVYTWGVLNIFQQFRTRKATDPRDNIFALFGLTDFGQSTQIPGVENELLIRTPRIPIDYSLSTRDTYRDFARAMIHWYTASYSDNFPPIDLHENDGRGPLDILLDAKLSEADPDWPSWVPDWRIDQSIHLPSSYASKRGTTYESAQLYEYSDPDCLAVGGVLLGEVDWINDQEHSYQILVDSDPRDLCKSIEARLGTSYRHGFGSRKAEIQPKRAGDQPTTCRLSDEQESTATAFLWTLTAGVVPQLFREAGVSVEAYEQEQILYKFMDVIRAHLGKGDILSLSEDEWSFCKPLKDLLKIDTLAMFDAQSRAKLCCRRIFTTDTGYIGTADLDTRPGDHVVLLLGMSMPVILRPYAIDDDKLIFRLIGDAWARGAMDGESLDSLDESGGSPVVIIIR